MRHNLPPRYLFAALSVCLALLVPQPAAAETAPLRADQIRALDVLMRDVDPQARALAREQLTRTLAPMSEAQIAMMMKGAETARTPHAKPAPAPPPARPVLASDIAYNHAQADPVIKQSWAAQKAFDVFVDAQMKASCPAPHSVARYGSGWRYEFADLEPNWVRASNSAELNLEVIGGSAVQTDGRYRYDFSKVRLSFDSAKVGAAIAQACKEHAAQARTFLAQLDALIAAKDFDGAFKLEQRAIAWSDPQRKTLNALFKAEDPSGEDLMLAFIDAKRIN